MTYSQTQPQATNVDDAESVRASAATLNEQLAHDVKGKLRDEVLDELAVAAQDLEVALEGRPSDEDGKVLRDLLDAVRLGELIVTQTWEEIHG